MMQYLKSVTSIHPETVIKIYATDKMFYFVPLCYPLKTETAKIYSAKKYTKKSELLEEK